MVAAVPGFPAVPGTGAERNEIEHPITAFYDGTCLRGVRDRAQYEQWAGPASESVCGFAITGQDERSRALGIDPGRASTERHVLDERQRLRSELEAYIRLLDRIPRLKPLAWFIGRPWIARGWYGSITGESNVGCTGADGWDEA